MVATDLVAADKEKKKEYINTWCMQTEETWVNCKRFITKKTLSFCPDFVLPDTTLSVDEIIDKFEEENID